MATVVLNAYSKAYPAVTLRIRASVLDWSGSTVIAQQTEDAPHPIRTWNFPGLPRDNYAFSLDVLNAGGFPIQNLAYFNVVPSELDGSIVRDNEQYQVGAVNSGLVAGESVAVFDGSDNKPDFRGWSIWPSISAGPNNPLVKDQDFSWDSDTGTLALLQLGDVFFDGAWWHFKFDSKSNTAGTSIPTIFDYTIRLIEDSDDIEYEDFANGILTEPANPYIELTLPDITTIPVGRTLKIFFGGTDLTCVKLVSADLSRNIFGLPGDYMEIVRFQKPDTSNMWLTNLVGGFNLVGMILNHDQIQAGIYKNFQQLNGLSADKFQYARIYQMVLELPGTQRCNYDDWSTGANKYLWSLANSANPVNLDKFHFPDRRDLYVCSNNTGKSGDYLANQVGEHVVNIPQGDSFNGPAGVAPVGRGSNNPNNRPVTVNAGLKTRPETVLINQYVLI